MKQRTRIRVRAWIVPVVLLLALGMLVAPAAADPHVGQSQNVVIIGGTTLDTGVPCSWSGAHANTMSATGGGCLPVSGPAGELGDFTFTPMDPSAVTAAALAPFDTAVLNVASSAMACNTANLSAQAQTDLMAFVEGGHKLIIFDSECYPGPVNYSWMPYPFTTANPGALGATGTLTIVEDNLLSTKVISDAHYIDAGHLGSSTDAVGDMNVMTSLDANWCVDMSGTNAIGVTGPVHTYANYPSGTDDGLFIYNGLDQDYLYFDDAQLRKMWVQELQQPFNPSGLECRITVVGITLEPETAENYVGEDHTVTATLTDLLGNPQVGVDVTFEVISGPNMGVSGTVATDAGGEAKFTYTGSGGMGTDVIVASFVNADGNVVYSVEVEKEWVALPVPVDVKPTSCRNPFNVEKKGVMPVAILGTADFDVTTVDPATVTLEGVSPLRWSFEDVATPYEPYLGKTGAFDCTEEGPDGYLDLTFKFDAKEIAAALGSVADGDVLVLHLDGFLFDGATYIIGEDVIVILMK